MRTTFSALALLLIAAAIATPGHAIGGSNRYQRAIYCAANASFIAAWISGQTGAQPGQAQGWRNDSELWLQAAIATGEFTDAQARSDRSEISSQINQQFYQRSDRRAYLEEVANTLERCKQDPPA